MLGLEGNQKLCTRNQPTRFARLFNLAQKLIDSYCVLWKQLSEEVQKPALNIYYILQVHYRAIKLKQLEVRQQLKFKVYFVVIVRFIFRPSSYRKGVLVECRTILNCSLSFCFEITEIGLLLQTVEWIINSDYNVCNNGSVGVVFVKNPPFSQLSTVRGSSF